VAGPRRGKTNLEDSVMDHLKRVTDEFARQAQTFDLFAEKPTIRSRRALAPAIWDKRRGIS
jgi:hypothetical protein